MKPAKAGVSKPEAPLKPPNEDSSPGDVVASKLYCAGVTESGTNFHLIVLDFLHRDRTSTSSLRTVTVVILWSVLMTITATILGTIMAVYLNFEFTFVTVVLCCVMMITSLCSSYVASNG